MVAERQRRQVQTGGPSFGSLDKLGQVMVAQFDGGHLLDERIRLFCGEPEIRQPDLGHLPRCSQLAQGQRRFGPGAEYDLDGGRQAEQQELKLIMAATFPDEVVVVKNDDPSAPRARTTH